jgi:RIP metalloprotease RseP
VTQAEPLEAPSPEEPPPPPPTADLAPNAAVRASLFAGALLLFGVVVGWKWLLIILGVVVLVFVHELGHYLMGRRAGMHVTEFFIGFGPRIFSFHRGGTEYGLKAIPAGAYVKVPGMYNIDEVDPAIEPFTFRQARSRDKLGMVLGGPFANLIMAVVLLFAFHLFIGGVDEERWAVGAVVAGTAAVDAGLEEGDVIRSLDGEPIATFEQLKDEVELRGGETVSFEVDRPDGDGAVSTVVLSTQLGDRLVEVESGSPADQMGLQADDILLGIDGEPTRSYADLAAASTARPGDEAEVRIERYSAECVLPVALGPDLSDQPTRGFLGLSPADAHTETKGLVGSATAAVSDFGSITWRSVEGLVQFFSPSRLGGFFEQVVTTAPVESVTEDEPCEPEPAGTISEEDEGRILSIYGAVRLGGQFTNIGGLVIFFALLNIFLGVFNLLPVLPLDGGHAVIALYEGWRRRSDENYSVDVTKVLPIAYMVVAVLVMVGVGALYLDIVDPIR